MRVHSSSRTRAVRGRLEPIAVGNLLWESLGNFARELDRRGINLSARVGGDAARRRGSLASARSSTA